jgi:hypothetical protein
MTVQELVTEIYEAAGEPSDLDIYDGSGEFDIASVGAVAILKYLNRAYERLANWKLPNGTNIRFSSLNRRKLFKTESYATTAGAGSTVSAIVLAAGASSSDDHYVEWTIEIGTSRKVVLAYDATTLTITPHEAFAVAPAEGAVVTLYKRFFKFYTDTAGLHSGEGIEIDPQEIVAIQSVRDLTQERSLERMSRTDESWGQMVQGTGSPGMFAQVAGGIEFDLAPTTGEAFLIRYYGKPEALTVASQVPAIPGPWHEPLLYLGVWVTLKKDRATDEAYSLKRDIQDMIVQTVQESERSFEFESGQLYIKE